MVKKILSYLLSLVIAFNLPAKKIDAHFLLGMYVGYLITSGFLCEVDRSECKKILQWQLDKCQKGLKEEQNIPIEEKIARGTEMQWRVWYFAVATFGLLCELFNVPYFHPFFCPQTKPADNSKKNKENFEKNQSKAEEPKVDNKQKS